MDPFTAIGLAGNIAQLIEISWKVVSKSREIRKNGASPEHRHMQLVTDDLSKINTRVMIYLERDDLDRGARAGDEELWRLCTSSNQIAAQLIQRLQACQFGAEKKVWKSLRQALKTEWNKGELDSVAAQLQTYRAQLNTRILVLVREEVSQISQTAENIMNALAEMRAFIGGNQEILKNYLTTLIASQSSKIQQMIGLPQLMRNPSRSLASRAMLNAQLSDVPETANPLHSSFFHAVELQDMAAVRNVLRTEPSIILSSNASGQTALHIAAGSGNTDLVDYLVRRGAEINPDDNDGQLPLHHAVRAQSATTVRSLVARAGDTSARDKQGRSAKDLSSDGSLIDWILTHGSSLEVVDNTGQTALGHFASHGDFEATQLLVGMGADMEKVNKTNGRTPLMEAVEANHVQVVRLLLSAGANGEARDLHQSTPLCVAASKGFNEIAGILLTHGADVNASNQHRNTPLHEACAHNRIDVSLTLIKAGADLRIRNEGQSSAWDLCAQKGHLTLFHAILATHPDMDINVTGRNDWSALEKASEQNHRDVVTFLLERGANPNIRFPLYHATLHGHTTVVKALIKHGADPERSYDDESPLYRACRSGRLETVMAVLETQKVNVNSLTKNNWTPLHQACWRGSTEIAQQLLRHGANPSIGDRRGYLPLHRAAQQGKAGVVKVLLELEFVNVNCTHEDKWTPLHEASCHGHMDVVEQLLNHGARTDLRTNTGQTPLALAASANHKNIVRLLMR